MRRSHRLQVLVAERELAGLRGASLSGLVFRRDGRLRHRLEGGAVELVVRVSTTSRDPRDAARAFAANHGRDLVLVFRGSVAVPPSPPLTGMPSFANAAHVIDVPFTTAFAYTGGTLVIDVEGRRTGTAGSLWPVDFTVDLQNPTAVSRGDGCGLWATPSPRTAAVSVESLLPGNTVRFVTWTQTSAAAVLMLGAQALDQDLTAFGATGCRLLVQPVVSVATVAGSATLPSAPGPANLYLAIPTSTAIAGAALVSQWMHFELPARSNPVGLTTSNALDLTFATTQPGLGASSVTSLPAAGSSLPDLGEVAVHRVPVIGLRY